MKKTSRRVVIGQAGLALAAALGVRSARATSIEDVLGSVGDATEALVELRDHLELAEDRLEELGRVRSFDEFSDSDLDRPVGTQSPDEALDDLDDDELIINGVRSDRMVPMSEIDSDEAMEFDTTVRVNGVPMAIKPPAENATSDGAPRGDSPPDTAEEPDGFTGFDPDDGSDSGGSEDSDGFGGFSPGDGNDGTRDSGGSGPDRDVSDVRQRRATEVLNGVRETVSDAEEALAEARTLGISSIEQELRRSQQLLEDIRTQLDTAETELTNDFERAVEMVANMAERVDARIDIMRDVMSDLNGDFDDGFGAGDPDFDDDFDAGDFDDGGFHGGGFGGF